jgi:hypothetical protein
MIKYLGKLFNLDVQSSSGTAVRITNTGTGNSFLVEDSASTDSTPFVIDQYGNVGIGLTIPTSLLTVAGDLNVDSGLLYVDSANNYLGINTLTPSYTLDVNGSANIAGSLDIFSDFSAGFGIFYVNKTNNAVGIGTSSPTARLEVVQSGSASAITIKNVGSGNSFLVEDSASPDSTPFVIDTNGNVGIGLTSVTQAKLEVIGSVRSYPAASQDAVVIAGRAGGTSSFASTITPAALTANRTLTLPDISGTLCVNLNNASTSTVSAGYAAETYLAGSAIVIPAGGWTAKTTYKCIFDMVKTAAGTGAFTVNVKMGTLGTTSDASILTLAFAAGTAVADTGRFEVVVVFRTVGSGTSAVIQGFVSCSHALASTGLITTGASGFGLINGTSSGFASTTQTTIGISVNGGTSFSGTNTLVQTELNLG